ncbi:MAG: CehA/McbA family metallohydrolase [bacterium]|nr:CehA/McbA family metallohydrolase [bacterium]
MLRLRAATAGLTAVMGAWACTSAPTRSAEAIQVIDGLVYHLGDDSTPEWDEAAPEPDGERLDVTFVPRSAEGEQLLVLEQRHVDNPWHVELNGERVATLRVGAERVEEIYVLPAGALQAGENHLALVPEVASDDITVGNLRIVPRSRREELGLRTVRVRVRDAENGEPLPARVTITNGAGRLARVYYAESVHAAVRPGVVYTSRGAASFELPLGEYRVLATRGSEWGLGEADLSVGSGSNEVELVLAREVDTSGFVACDTHIHTLTHSGHGDASVEERVVTLAGEGVELAIATDHNHNTDYTPQQSRAGLDDAFTSVVGNEVTTDIGHFNGFPLDPADTVPDYELTDPVALVAEIREHGAEVVILNHPRWPNHPDSPFGTVALDRFSGERKLAYPLTFDATELVNSDTREHDPMFLFVDWFALLNRGERVVAVGSSDSHTVGSPVGQGRTYVKSSTDDPARIDLDEAFANIREGRSSIGLGIFSEVELQDGATPGALAPVRGERVSGTLRVAAPAWVDPRTATVFADGVPVWSAELAPDGEPFDERFRFEFAWPYGHDAWLVCVVLGDDVGGAYWPSVNPYTLAATNPIWLDGDGDGRYTSPRETAEAMLGGGGGGGGGGGDGAIAVSDIEQALSTCDDAVAIQVLSAARNEWMAATEERVRRAAGPRAREGLIERYLESLRAR